MLLTDDLSARVVRRDGDSASGTLGRFLQPHFHTGRAEHVVVGTDDRLSDLQTARAHVRHRNTNTNVHFNKPFRHKLAEYQRWSNINNYLTMTEALGCIEQNPDCQTEGSAAPVVWLPVLGCYLSEAYLTRDRQSQTESRRLEVESHCCGEEHTPYTNSTQLPLKEVQISHQFASRPRGFAPNYGKPRGQKYLRLLKQTIEAIKRLRHRKRKIGYFMTKSLCVLKCG